MTDPTPITQAGIYDLDIDTYHAGPCAEPSISHSGLRQLEQCPAKYWYWSPLNPNPPERETKAHFSYGKAAHSLLLEGEDAFWRDFAVLPEDHNPRTKDGKAERERLEADGYTVLKHGDHAAIVAMRDALAANPTAAAAFQNCDMEKSLIWQDAETGVWLRCRPDALPRARRLIPDYKTTQSAHPEDLRKSVWNFGWHTQAALYLDGIEAVTGERPEAFFYVAQEKEPPYPVTLVTLSDEALEWGRMQNRRAIRLFAECLERDHWPGYADDVVELGLPGWAEKRLQDRLDAGEFMDAPQQAAQ